MYDPGERVGVQQVHPFLFDDAAFALAMNGDLFDFGRMRYDLLEHIPAALSTRIEGTTDSEWFYALALAQLQNPFERCTASEMAAAARRALEIVREIRERRGIDTQSPINLVLRDGRSLIATRFVFDYGWYPQDDSFFAAERERDYTTPLLRHRDQYRLAQPRRARHAPRPNELTGRRLRAAYRRSLHMGARARILDPDRQPQR